jgi:hypothetical protein
MGPDETLAQNAIKDVRRDNNVLYIYPNPANGKLNIQFHDSKYTNGIVKIIDLQGRLLQIINFDGNLTKVADVSYLDPGIYVMKFEQNNQLIAVDRFLKK